MRNKEIPNLKIEYCRKQEGEKWKAKESLIIEYYSTNKRNGLILKLFDLARKVFHHFEH